MHKTAQWIVQHRRTVLALAVVGAVLSLFAMPGVHISYDLASYLPPDSPSKRALEFLGSGLPNLQVYLPGVPPQDALSVKAELAAIPAVSSVLWLDDVIDLRARPWESLPVDMLGSYYAQGGPLFQLTLDPAHSVKAIAAIEALYPNAVFKGEAINQAKLQSVSMGEVSSIMLYVLPLVLIILLLTTSHWIEPLLFLIVIGIAILMNEGTNIIFGSVSFVTQACSAVLQLAVSIDYAVFLLYRFSEYRQQGLDAPEAMVRAMQTAASSIAASAMTTVFGFLALLAMAFGIGRDMGMVLAKGVLLSYLSVMVVLPAAVISVEKWLKKTAHRSFLPSFVPFSRAVVRFGMPLAIAALLVLPPAYLAQQRNAFLYGSGGMHAENSPVRAQADHIDSLFGRSQTMLLMVPEKDRAKAARLSQEVGELPRVRGIISYAQSVGVEIPPQVVPQDALLQLMDRGYQRIIITADVEDESQTSFKLVEDVRALAYAAYGEDYYFIGENVVNYDLMASITSDGIKVLLLGLLAIGGILLITFANLTIPFVLLLVIEGSIWLNMAIPYFAGSPMNYIGYQIISSVQLGATVDYGILLAQRFLEARRTMPADDAAARALQKSAGSILPPMMILVIAGYALALVVTSNGIISQMGEIIGRGAAISGLMVLLVLPKLLQWLDPLIQKTYLRKQEVFKG